MLRKDTFYILLHILAFELILGLIFNETKCESLDSNSSTYNLLNIVGETVCLSVMNFFTYHQPVPTTSRHASEVAAQIFQRQNLDKANILGEKKSSKNRLLFINHLYLFQIISITNQTTNCG